MRQIILLLLCAAIVTGQQVARNQTPVDQIVSLLHDRDVLCQKCRYNLRGCPSDICPECGERIDLDLVYRAMSWDDVERSARGTSG